jgi:hypothetical protein
VSIASKVVGYLGAVYNLYREAADVLALRRGANPQAVRIYNTTDGTNFERALLAWLSNILELKTEAGGTGTAGRQMKLTAGADLTLAADAQGVGSLLLFMTNGANRWGLTATTLRPMTDNVYDLGSSGNRVKDGYFAGVITLGSLAGPATSPAQITADQNNYAPAAGYFQRWSSDAARTVTGMVSAADGTVRLIWNVGAQSIILANESASSTAANRFTTSTAASLTVTANKCALCVYDLASTRWRATLLP